MWSNSVLVVVLLVLPWRADGSMGRVEGERPVLASTRL
jgi:hypothetical protein